MYRKFNDGDQIILTPLAKGKNPIQARISDGEKSQPYTDVRTADVISMTIISKDYTNLPKIKRTKKALQKRKKHFQNNISAN